MNDFKLKMTLSILGGIVFSFIFILLTFALPIQQKEHVVIKKAKGKLEIISQSLQNR
ncbi:hypothetical protein [Sulfurimonas aquatica]|uniref:hypothetical protein n=1 Tax=Sulfurimonas aquatica TaxID=2672570 RepID=UPI001A99092E|nr:hypothetical protein [Sulfurimonas aquatica]